MTLLSLKPKQVIAPSNELGSCSAGSVAVTPAFFILAPTAKLPYRSTTRT